MNDAATLFSEIIGPVAITVLLASATIFLILYNSRKPRLFILWIIGSHTLIFSALGLILISDVLYSLPVAESAVQRDLQFDLMLGICLGFGILIEGGLLYLVCRLRSSSRTTLAAPSIFKSLFAALMGNAFSIGGFLIFSRLFDVVWQFLSSPALPGD
ncbi:MAG TPA: hypothetical protein VNV43_12210 [Candidatus Acidoferrales bacterium]|jgi:hypothetical protein|nr:hypothetical protein [Candidatus Acidoferrales bacterium]